MDLRNLIEPHLDMVRLAKDLDELGHWGRLWAVRQWTRADMSTLWEAAKGFRPLGLDDFVPTSVAPLTEVVHHGTNTLPAFGTFEKHFCKPADPGSSGALFGFNSQWYETFTGPGYFIARPSGEPGEVEIDYASPPKERPTSWPEIAPSSARLGRFVYHGGCDTMRGLASHVSIGRVKKGGRWMDVWFALVREDPKPPS